MATRYKYPQAWLDNESLHWDEKKLRDNLQAIAALLSDDLLQTLFDLDLDDDGYFKETTEDAV